MKRIIKYTLLIIAILLAIFIILNYPVSSKAKSFARLADTANIKRNLELIINTPAYRNYKNITVLDTVAERIKNEFNDIVTEYIHKITR